MYDTESSIFTKDGLNARERRFCHIYLSNNCDMSKTHSNEFGLSRKCCYNMLNRPHVRDYLKSKVEAVEKELHITLTDKYRKLWHIADTCFPDHADSEDLKMYRPESSINAIKEMNKMKGDYAPEKHIVESKDDIDAVNQIIEELNKKYKREF